jgi:hypothetical protein
VARRQIKERGGQGDGMALAGIIAGWIITGLWICGCGAYFVGAFFLISRGTASGT